jgi:ribosomal protein L11 methyltransferase
VLTPQIQLYAVGTPAPPTLEGGLALAHFPTQSGGPIVFGDGSHPTTRLCAGVVDLLCRQRQPGAVLDVGTGTGVLARIARARGVRLVIGTDLDPDALASAEAHAALDAASTQIRFCRCAPDAWGARFDLVVANILEEPLRQLAPAFKRASVIGGDVLVSGFTRPQSPAIRVAFEQVGLLFVSESHLDEWVLLRFRAA